MNALRFLLAACLAVSASGLELTPDNFDSAVAGKTVFIKFLAPWWGHCKSMKPAWDSLMAEFKDSPTILIADVDCTAAGKPLCDSNGVKGYPTIKFGDPSNLEDYKGGRDEKALKDFAKSLKPSCSPANIDLCDDEAKARIVALQALSEADLQAQIDEKEALLAEAETTFKTELEKLQKAYEQLQKNKETTETEVKESGLSLMKAVKAAGGKKHAEL